MDYELLKTAAEKITMPEDMKDRLERKVKRQNGNTPRKTIFLRKPAAIAAAVAVCLSLSVTAMAATGSGRGFFRDVTNFFGAITGMVYEQATHEIRVEGTVEGDVMTLLAIFADPRAIPYRETEQLGIGEYRILDGTGSVAQEGTAKAAEVIHGSAAIRLPLEGLEAGSYTLQITTFVAEKKADQPLPIRGAWELAFVK